MDWSELLLCAIIGLALIIGGAWWGVGKYSFYQRCGHAQGVVVDQFEKEGSKFSTFYYPVVEFTTEKGEKVQFRGAAGNSGGPQIANGTTVDVLYDPANPSRAQINSFIQFWLGPVGLAVMGLVILVMGFFKAGGK